MFSLIGWKKLSCTDLFPPNVCMQEFCFSFNYYPPLAKCHLLIMRPHNRTNCSEMLIRLDLLTDALPRQKKHLSLILDFQPDRNGKLGGKYCQQLCLSTKKMCLEAVPSHLAYIIKFVVANQTVCSHSIPVRISDNSLAENRKLTQKIWETGLNCLSPGIS